MTHVQTTTRMPTRFHRRYKGRITRQMDRFLFGRGGFARIEDALEFARAFMVMTADDFTRRRYADETLPHVSKFRRDDDDCRALSAWFRHRLSLRLEKTTWPELRVLGDKGLTLSDVADILLKQCTQKKERMEEAIPAPFVPPEPWQDPPGALPYDDVPLVDLEISEEEWYGEDAELLEERLNDPIRPENWPRNPLVNMVFDLGQSPLVVKLALMQMPVDMLIWAMDYLRMIGRGRRPGILPPQPQTLLCTRSALAARYEHLKHWLYGSHLEPAEKGTAAFNARVQWDFAGVTLVLDDCEGHAVNYHVDFHQGIILKQNADRSWVVRNDLYFAMQRCRSYDRLYNRGKRDVFAMFIRNLRSVTYDAFINEETHASELERFMTRLSSRMLRACDKQAKRQAFEFTPRLGQQWSVYGVFRQFGPESREAFRVREFAARFPTLFRLLPHDDISGVIASGKSVRKHCIWWNPLYRDGASQPVNSYQSALDVLLGRVARTYLEAENIPPMKVIREAAEIVGFRPTLRQSSLFRLAFWLWLMEQVSQGGRDLDDLHFFWWELRRKHVRVTPKNRHVLTEMFKAIENREFPRQWVANYVEDDHRIDSIRCSHDLRMLGKQMQNCVYTYRSRILNQFSQIYVLRSAETFEDVATLELNPTDDGYALVQALGPENEPLDDRAMAVITRWCDSNGTSIDEDLEH